MKNLGVFLFLLLSLSACDPSHVYSNIDVGIEAPQKVVESVSFNELYLKVLEPKCIGCHSGSAEINLETYENVVKDGAKIRRAVLVRRMMPMEPFSALTPEQLQLFAAWFQAKAPKIPRNGDLPPIIEKLEPTFDSIYTKVIVPRCVACHNPDGKGKDVPLDSPEDMMSPLSKVMIPGQPEKSDLYLALLDSAKRRMPPRKSKISPLSEGEIQVIHDWILNFK